MESLTKEVLFDLMREREGPCLSLYQNTHRHHPDNTQDPIRFGNLIKQLEDSLQQQPAALRTKLLQPFYQLRNDNDFWSHTLDGLVVLSAPEEHRILKTHRPVVDFAVVADTWHVKPLFRIFQTAESFQVLCLTREWVRLYEGNRDVLDEVELADGVPENITDALGEELTEPYQKVSQYGVGPGGAGSGMRHGHGGRKDEIVKDTERFFRVIDKAILEHHSRPSGLPLVLVSLPEYQGIFRGLTQNPFLYKEGVSLDPGALDIEQLRQNAWRVIEPELQQNVRQWIELFQERITKGLGSEQLEETMKAAADGRIDMLLVDADKHVPGWLDLERRKIVHADDFDDPTVGDVLDDMVELVLRHGGKTLIIPKSVMPTQSGIAASYRY